MIPNWIIVVGGYLLAFAVTLRIVMQRREPTATLAWALTMMLVPYLGVLLYLLLGRHRLTRQVRRRRARAAALEPHLARLEITESSGRFDSVSISRPPDRELVRLSNRMGCRQPTFGNDVRLLVDANEAYQAMENAIRAATKHVHFQFYIYNEDDTGLRFRDLLIQKAKEGVKVRVLTDGVGSFGLDTFMIPLVQAGGQFAEFLPVGLFSRHWHANLRNHRKNVVVDGRVAFTGGVNIGDEYTGRKRKVGLWRDTHVQLEGPAVHHVQEAFAEDWFFSTGEEPDDPEWFPEQHRAGNLMVQIVASGPDTDTQPIQRIFFTVVTSAKERVYLTTPYFVPDQAMLVALQTTALRGVDVRLLLPRRSDQSLALHAGRSYYDELLEAGVRVFEYRPGILHAKTMVVDQSWATVGSANMDMRSFRLNFEINAVVYGPDFARQLAELFEKDLRDAEEITKELLDGRGLGRRMAESFARTLAPVL
ncbi:MAG: cardiolipin synthase [Deltaproteobacteria bacterium]|nr:cardiolipin synthase [Deltaproteobacteria bacterium]